MPSHLTRHVFRCLISNEPITHPGCLRRHVPGALSRWRVARYRHITYRTRPLPTTRHEQRRTLFSFPSFGNSSRDQRAKSYDPGIDIMMDLSRRKRMQARLTDVKTVCRAINDYWTSKNTPGLTHMPDTHAALLLESYRYCIAGGAVLSKGSEQSDVDSAPVLESNFNLLAYLDADVTTTHLELAQFLYDQKLQQTQNVAGSLELRGLINVLCCLDKPSDALKALTQINTTSSADSNPPNHKAALTSILSAFKRLNDEAGISATLDAGRNLNLEQFGPAIVLMTQFYADRDDLPQVEKWFKALQPGDESHIHTGDDLAKALRATLGCCLRTKRLDLGHALIREVMVKNPNKLVWDEILVWGFNLQKSVDEVNRMMDVMVQSNKEIKKRQHWRLPDTATINRLVETAIADKDPYIAERLISIGKDRGIEPDARTLTLQMQYRLDVNDVDGALIAYKHLQSRDLSSKEDVPVVNRLIFALAKTGRHDYETIMNVAADLSDRNANFEPATVQALAVIHLKRDELDDVQDLIKTHAHDFSSADRATLRGAIKKFCLDSTTPTANMWDAYNILRQQFDEMPRSERTEIMQSCFDRKRPDMAVHVFNHMRVHSRQDTMPNVDTYITGLIGASQIKDSQSLRALHNQLKLDTNIDHNTRLLNALMIAYLACEQGEEALSIWDDVIESREGPSYNSIHIALRACEKTDFAEAKAQEIWDRLQRNAVDLDQKLWASYIAALAGNGDINFAVTTLEEAHRNGEVELDPLLLGSLYNSAIMTGKQHMIAAWASSEHPEAWERLATVPLASNEYRAQSYQVDRSLKP